MSNQSNNVLYIGVTNNIERRVVEHKSGLVKGFTSSYKCDKLVYFEQYTNVNDAIYREKQLKNWKRDWKEKLIDTMNIERKDLSFGYDGDCGSSPQ